MQQQVNGQTTNYLWDEFSLFGDVVLESDGGGALLASYTLGNGRMLSQSRGGVPSYYLQDGQGSTRALTDASGAVTDSSSYTAFGETYSQSSATPNTYLYTGQQYDAGTGLYNLRARYYNPGLGRFLSRDSAEVLYGNPVELNRYAYAANNPVNYYDPSGNISLTWGQLNRNSVKAASIAFPPVAKFVGSVIIATVLTLVFIELAKDPVTFPEFPFPPKGLDPDALAQAGREIVEAGYLILKEALKNLLQKKVFEQIKR